MLPIRAVLTVAVVSALLTRQALSASTELLSVEGIPIRAEQHLTKVEIRTWGVQVLSVCHIAPVSAVSADVKIDPSGVLVWKANVWHGEIGKDDMTYLHNLFLVS